MSPSEFWQMQPFEFWWLIEAKGPPKYGSLSEREVEELYAILPPKRKRATTK